MRGPAYTRIGAGPASLLSGNRVWCKEISYLICDLVIENYCEICVESEACNTKDRLGVYHEISVVAGDICISRIFYHNLNKIFHIIK